MPWKRYYYRRAVIGRESWENCFKNGSGVKCRYISADMPKSSEVGWAMPTERTMKIEYDKEVDALYIRIQEKKVARTKEVEEGINLDFDEKGKVIGLEIIGAVERYSLEDIFNFSTENLILETPGRVAVRHKRN